MDIYSAPDIFTIVPAATVNYQVGEFTVSLNSSQTVQLETGDVFDIELSDADRVWTVCQGKMIIIEDVTD